MNLPEESKEILKDALKLISPWIVGILAISLLQTIL